MSLDRPTFRGRGTELLQHLADHVASVLEEAYDLDAGTAARAGHDVAARMAATWGGQNVYIPIGAWDTTERDAEIWRKFDGRNAPEIARELGVSLVTVYAAIKRARAHEVATRQGSLLPDE